MLSLPSLLSFGFSLILIVILLWKRRGAPLLFSLLPLMVVVAWIQGIHWYGFSDLSPPLLWKQLALSGELVFPFAIGYVGQRFFRFLEGGTRSNEQWWWTGISGVAGLFMVGVWLFPDMVMHEIHGGEIGFRRAAGLAIWSFILITLVVGLSQLEQIFRGTDDLFRYQLKFVLIGLGGLVGMGIVQASQMLLLPVWNPMFIWVGGVTSSLSLLFIGFGVVRCRIMDWRQKVQVSHQALFTSFTVILVGAYLLLVGLVDHLIQTTGWPMTEALRVLGIFVAGMLLVLLVLSRQGRLRLQNFVSRHFFRSKYDYRQKWLQVTEKFLACFNSEEVWDRYLEWLGQTFGASRISIWKRFEADGQFHQIRSLNVENLPSIPDSHRLIQELKHRRGPFFLHTYGLAWEELGDFGKGTQAHLCVPILRSKGAVMGFCTLSRDCNGREYDRDDFDLLWVMAHHVAMLLLQFHLQEERSSSAKWEAVHRFSAFYLHDLKNLAGSLSLVVQNAEHYGDDPGFHASAMQTVRNTSNRIMELMGKIAYQIKTPAAPSADQIKPLDINGLIRDILHGLNGNGCKPVFHAGVDIPPLRLQQESMAQVILNLVLNARQAMGEKGRLDITTSLAGNEVVLEVVDTGPGMSSHQLEHLFEPFRSSKKTGLGVGLFQCKRIVEDHRGRIRVESLLGKGTKIIVTFPVETADKMVD